ncbi:hypothetical protein BH23VER1_BH23VER1_06040 [soil metagenome]
MPLVLVFRLSALPFALSLLDMAVTLNYQPAAYWEGDRSSVVEANPAVWLALRIHPLLLVPGCVGWYALFWFLIFRTPAWIGLRFWLFLILGHSWAVGSWWVRHAEHPWLLVSLLAAAVAPVALLALAPFRDQWDARGRIVGARGSSETCTHGSR